MKKKIVIALIIGVVLVAGGSIGYCVFHNMNDSQMDEETYIVSRGELSSVISFSGNIEGTDPRNIYSRADGIIQKLYVKVGDEVKEGDLIAELDTTEAEYDIQMKEASLEKTILSNQYATLEKKNQIAQYKEQIENGLETSVYQAQQALLKAQEKCSAAADEYNELKLKIDNGTYSSIYNAQTAIDEANISISKQSNTYEASKKQSKDSEERKNAELDLYSAQKNLETAKEKLEIAKKDANLELENKLEAYTEAQEELKNAETAYDSVALISKQKEDNNALELKKQADLSDAEASQLEIDKLKASLSKYKLYANGNGRITVLKYAQGEFAPKDNLAGTIVNMDTLQMKFKINELDVAGISVGDQADIIVNATNGVFSGVVESISDIATVENGISSFEGIVTFKQDGTLKSGMSAVLNVTKFKYEDVLIIPAEAIQMNDESGWMPFVTVKSPDGSKEMRMIVTDHNNGSDFEVIDGLSEGEEIVIPSVPDTIYEQDKDE